MARRGGLRLSVGRSAWTRPLSRLPLMPQVLIGMVCGLCYDNWGTLQAMHKNKQGHHSIGNLQAPEAGAVANAKRD